MNPSSCTVVIPSHYQLCEVEEHLEFTEQKTSSREMLLQKEKLVEKTSSTLSNVEEDHCTLQWVDPQFPYRHYAPSTPPLSSSTL